MILRARKFQHIATNNRHEMTNCCIDCGAEIGPTSTRCAARARWGNEEYRCKVSEASKTRSASYRRALSERMKKRWREDDDYLQRMAKMSSELMRMNWEDEGFR